MALDERRIKKNKSRPIPYRLAWYDSEELDEFGDVGGPQNLGRRRPRHDEWGDYIEDEQMLHIENLMSGQLADLSEFGDKELRSIELRKGRLLGNIGVMEHGPQLGV